MGKKPRRNITDLHNQKSTWTPIDEHREPVRSHDHLPTPPGEVESDSEWQPHVFSRQMIRPRNCLMMSLLKEVTMWRSGIEMSKIPSYEEENAKKAALDELGTCPSAIMTTLSH